MIEIVKNQLDVGLVSGCLEIVDFWRDEAGLTFDHLLPVARGHDQHRFDERGSVIKVNIRESIEGDQRSGIEKVLIADSDGNRMTFVPNGFDGVTQIGVQIAVPDLLRTMNYYRDVLEFKEEAENRVRCGDSVVLFEERAGAPSGFAQAQRGWLYLTVQVRNCDEEVARIEAAGGWVVVTPRNLGKIARMAMIRDPDGNLLEVSQRASLTGALPVI
jgi:predicted enzyme related to lactoylglutathione lyase